MSRLREFHKFFVEESAVFVLGKPAREVPWGWDKVTYLILFPYAYMKFMYLCVKENRL